jgi:hypothetical protein
MVNPVIVQSDQATALANIATNLDALRTANSITQAQRDGVSAYQDGKNAANPAYVLATLDALAAAVASLESRVA